MTSQNKLTLELLQLLGVKDLDYITKATIVLCVNEPVSITIERYARTPADKEKLKKIKQHFIVEKITEQPTGRGDQISTTS